MRRAASPTSRSSPGWDRRGTTVVFDTGGGSSQFTFGHAGVVDERFSVDVGAARYTEGSGSTGRSGPRRSGRRARRSRRTWSGSTGGRALTSSWDGRRHHEPHGRKLALATYDPEAVQGARLRGGGGRRPDRAVPGADTDGRRDDHGPPAQAGGGHPRGRMHRPDRDGDARPQIAHRQRPRAAARGARRAVRPHLAAGEAGSTKVDGGS